MDALRQHVRTIGRHVREPRKLAHLLTSRAGLHALRYLIAPPRHGRIEDRDEGIAARRYTNYDDYVRHQRSKLAIVDLTDYDKDFRAYLAERLREGDWAGRSVLCLAARIGTEVRAFHDAGAFAIGIDLEPGKNNRWVVPGDFHNLVFPDSCVDGVYCNSLDHALDLKRLLAEMKRILKPQGKLLIDAQDGSEEFDDWAVTAWKKIDDLVEVIESCGFALSERKPIVLPQPGEQLLFVVSMAR